MEQVVELLPVEPGEREEVEREISTARMNASQKTMIFGGEKTMRNDFDLHEELGRAVRLAWVAYCHETGDTKPSHLAPWEELSEWDKEADRQIGVAIATMTAERMAIMLEHLADLGGADYLTKPQDVLYDAAERIRRAVAQQSGGTEGT